jgi:hypothetical protein
MTPRRRQAPDVAAGEAVIEEFLRTALWLFDISTSLLEEMPDGTFPGEDSGAVLIEMLAGSCRPAIESAGEAGCQAIVGLAAAIRENVRDDLALAAKMASGNEVLL